MVVGKHGKVPNSLISYQPQKTQEHEFPHYSINFRDHDFKPEYFHYTTLHEESKKILDRELTKTGYIEAFILKYPT